MSLNQNKKLSINEKKFFRRIYDTARLIRDIEGKTAILTHYDTDGLAAGGALLRYFTLEEKPFIIRAVTKLDDLTLKEFFSLTTNNYIILDMGSDLDRVIPMWKELRSNGDLIIIDHHKISTYDEYIENFTFINPEYYGLDGGTTACTAISASLIAYYATKERDNYFLELGIVGGYGDMQFQNDITPINLVFLNKAIEKGVVKHIRDFIFFLNRRLPLFRALTWMFIPYIPRFSGRDDVGINILEKAGVPIEKNGRPLTVADLDDNKKEEILSIILEYLSSLGVSISIDNLIKKSFEFLHEEDDILSTAEGFSTLLSALGRMEKESFGLLLAGGARGTILSEAKEIMEKRRKIINRYLEEAIRRAEIYSDKIVVIDFRKFDFNPRFSGSISTILSRSITYSNKIIIVISEEEDTMKISARAPRDLVNKGFDLSEIMKKVSKKVGGVGGGHNIAAGATLYSKDDTAKNIIITEIMGALPRE